MLRLGRLRKAFTDLRPAPYLYYFTFLFCFWVIHLISISAVSSIHFSLGHDLKITEDWIYNKAWIMVTIANCSAFYLVYNLFSIKSSISPLKKYLTYQSWGHYRKRSFVLILFSYFSIFYLGGSASFSSQDVDLIFFISNTLGIALLLVLNFILLFLLSERYFLENSEAKLIFIIVSVLSYTLCFEATVLYKVNQIAVFYLILAQLLFLLVGDNYYWNIGAYFLVAFCLPVISLFGFDPIYGKEFSPLHFHNKINLLSFIFTVLIGLGYIFINKFKRKNIQV